MVFEHAKSQLNVPATRIQRHDLSSTQLTRIGDIGNITVPLSSITHPDQSHEMGSLIRTIGSQKNERFKIAIALHQDMFNGVGPIASQTSHPPDPSLRQGIKPLKIVIS